MLEVIVRYPSDWDWTDTAQHIRETCCLQGAGRSKKAPA